MDAPRPNWPRLAVLAAGPAVPPLALLVMGEGVGEVAVAVAAVAGLAALAARLGAGPGEDAVLAERGRSEARLRGLTLRSDDVVVIVDDRDRIRSVGPSVERVWGRPAGELVGGQIDALLHPEDRARLKGHLAEVRTQGWQTALQARVRSGGAGFRQVEVLADDLRGTSGVEGLALTFRPLPEGAQLERQLVHHTLHDALTGLANRALFGDRVEHALARRERATGFVAVLVLDLDDFRVANEALGQVAGDELLVAVAQRVTSCLRDGDTAARLGGDEFAMLLEDVPEVAGVSAVADRVLEVLSLPLTVGEQAVAVGASLGIALAGTYATAQGLLTEARSALEQAKVNGKGRKEVFVPPRPDRALSRVELKAELARGLARDELFLLYQPVVDLAGGRTVGAEALLRWRHPSRGLLTPSEFLPIAEEAGLAVPLGRRVLTEACEAARGWRSGGADAGAVYVSVNVGAPQVRDPGFPDDVRRALDRSGLEAGALVLELAEGLVVADTAAVVETAAKLRALGVRLAIDDFGTGSGSPSYLEHLHVDLLKIDRAFVGELGRGTTRPTTIRGILSLARTLGLTPIAEGVEQERQRGDLVGLRCPYGQGSLFSEPVDADRIGALLAGSA
jgi:diguanylate cyclase (GGDEF)-like protein/PAS domain S-box-containing protein